MKSVRKILDDCMGLTGEISINRDLYGYRFNRNKGGVFNDPLDKLDILPGTIEPTARRLLEQLDLIQKPSINVRIHLVGASTLTDTTMVSNTQRLLIQYAIQVTRDIYAQVGLGIRKVDWRPLASTQRNFTYNQDTRTLAQNNTSNDRTIIDLFWIQNMNGAGGQNTQWGCIIELVGRSHRNLGILLAHEMGHHLDLSHNRTANPISICNVMGYDPVPNDNRDIGETNRYSVRLTDSQGITMRGARKVQPAVSVPDFVP